MGHGRRWAWAEEARPTSRAPGCRHLLGRAGGGVQADPWSDRGRTSIARAAVVPAARVAAVAVVVPAVAGGVLLLPAVAAATVVGVAVGTLPVAGGLAVARNLPVAGGLAIARTLAIVVGARCVAGAIERRLLLDQSGVLELRLTEEKQRPHL
jgi:hypothetical protein